MTEVSGIPIESRSLVVFRLSTREREVVALAAQGATDKEIADRLSTSIPTLRADWTRIRDKVGAVNRTHAIVLAAKEGEAPAVSGDERTRIVDSLAKDRVSNWVWHGRRRQALLDDLSRRFFGLSRSDEGIPLDRLLAHVWAPDRARFERYLCQASDLRPMTPIEMRVGVPGDYSNLIRTINLASQSGSDSPVLLLASTVMHVFDARR